MQYRRFGRTNLQMPVFSCGGMRYQHKWQDVPLSEIPAENQANLEATIRRSFEVGINHIETARGYGSSERQLGLFLPKLPREKLIVQTKILAQPDADQFTREFEESLVRLQLDHVDLLSVHGVNNAELVEQTLGPGGCLSAARKLQQRGLAKHIGFSTHATLPQIMQCIEHTRDGGFDYINLHWYYIFQRNWPAIEAAAAHDMGVFIISPADKGGKLYEPSDKLTELCKPLHPLVFNNLFCLSHPQVHTLSIGAARPSDFDLHLQTLPHLDHANEVLAPILERLKSAYESAVAPAIRNPFALQLPEWDQTPGGVNLPIILWLRNLVAAFDMRGYAKMRYNLLGSGDHWFPGTNAAELDESAIASALPKGVDPQQLIPILKEVHVLVGGAGVKRLSQSTSNDLREISPVSPFAMTSKPRGNPV